MANQDQVVPAEDRRATAFHEAGHVVAAYRFNHYVAGVTIKRSEGLIGSALTEGESADGSTDEEQVIVLFAGLASERMVRPSALATEGAAGDYEQAEALLHDRFASMRARLEERAAAIVAKDRPAVEAVAAALLAHETLPGDEATIVVDCIDEGEDWRDVLAKYRAFRALSDE